MWEVENRRLGNAQHLYGSRPQSADYQDRIKGCWDELQSKTDDL